MTGGRFHEFTLAEALEIAKRNDPGEGVPSVSRTLIAEVERLRARSAPHIDGTTHAEGCHAWGRPHYECALAEIERLRVRIEAQRDVMQAEIDALMYEHCPEDMTPEQRAEWEASQRAVVGPE